MPVFVNEVRLIGNLGADPEIHYTADDTPVTTLSVATTFRRGDVEHTEWHRVVLWRALAERTRSMRKGSSLWVQGRLQSRSYEQDGSTRWTTEIIAENVLILSGWREERRLEGEQSPPAENAPGNAAERPSVPLPGSAPDPF